ncbi:geranylgeranylglycerol-phosphate geranylgeranyltransferase [Candidatus Bathyarchaeota archaeon]|nr:geranylgeranylglycerol-phosphate geranylgeranyltransferase [Candidatus Bathyarchaeota archaeon]
MGKFKGFWQIIRPLNSFMMGFAVIVGASLVSNLILTRNLFLGFLTSFSLTAASMVINDLYDREIDAINEPNRPIPRGDISLKEALVFSVVLSLLGLISAFITNQPSFILAMIAWIISISYITKGKSTGLPGNFLVSATVVTPIIYGGLAIGQLQTSTLLFVAIIFFSNTSREITKGIVDIEGDKSHKIRTIAVRYGARVAAILASIFSIFAVILSPLPWIWHLVSNLFLPLVIITDLGLIASSVLLLKNYSRNNAKKIKTLNLVWFVTGLMAFILGTI